MSEKEQPMYLVTAAHAEGRAQIIWDEEADTEEKARASAAEARQHYPIVRVWVLFSAAPPGAGS